MTVKEIILKCLDENTDVTCRHKPCDLPEKEGNTGECCHKCSLEILKEYEKEIKNKILDDFVNKAEETKKHYTDTFTDYLCSGINMCINLAKELRRENDKRR